MLVFLYDGRVEMDSNFVENRIRPLKLTAKNALFAGHDEGARSWGRVGSLIETCKMNGVEPSAWIKSTLEKIAAGHPLSKIHELSGRALARAPLGGGIPALPFRLQGGVTVPPWATFPAALPRILYVGFSPVRLQASGTLQFGTKPSAGLSRSRPIPPYPRSDTALAPPFDKCRTSGDASPLRAKPPATASPPEPRGPRSSQVMLSRPSSLVGLIRQSGRLRFIYRYDRL